MRQPEEQGFLTHLPVNNYHPVEMLCRADRQSVSTAKEIAREISYRCQTMDYRAI